ncbi:zinc finger, C2H2 type, putative, partial [Ixodes scapularis]
HRSCAVCGKAFARNSDRNRHVKIHTGVRPFQCDVCSRKFRQSWHLQLSLMPPADPQAEFDNIPAYPQAESYTAHPLYTLQPICAVCGKAFARNSDRNRHVKIHTGVRPFQCDVCSRKFRQSWHLQYHRSTHGDL